MQRKRPPITEQTPSQATQPPTTPPAEVPPPKFEPPLQFYWRMLERPDWRELMELLAK